MSETKAPAGQEIRGVMLPVGEHYLLLPNAAVAEVIGYLPPEVAVGDLDYCLGWVDWRGQRIPVVSIERAIGEQESTGFTRRARIAVLNTLNNNQRLPYVGVLTQGISRLVRVTQDNIKDAADGCPASPLLHGAATINGQLAWIPNLDELERLLTAA
jgi:chemosensory pili system protein ChpC